MNFIEAIQTCFRKYVDFSGRATRAEFWWFALFQVIALVLASLVNNTVYMLAGLVMLLPALSVGARRLHDIGKSGWLQLIILIPLVGILVLIYFWVQPTPQDGGNTAVASPGQ